MSMPDPRVELRRRLGRLTPLLALLLVAGCGPSSAKVTGKVSYKDQTLTSGTVTFFGPDDSRKSGSIGPDGTYTITDPPLGPVRIAIFAHPRVPPGLTQSFQKA